MDTLGEAPPSAWRSWAAMMLAGSLLAAMADARAWRNMLMDMPSTS